MAKRQESRWAVVRNNVLGVLESLTLRIKECPTRLRMFAEERRITEVRFQPLLIQACTAVCEDGFIVFVNCGPDEVDAYQQEWLADDGAGSGLPARVRFSIAHEIAHTLFYSVAVAPPRPLIDVDHSAYRRRIDALCSRCAARLLIPTRFLQEAASERRITAPPEFIEMTELFRVSPECLLWRLRDSSVRPDSLGCIALVRQGRDGLQVVKWVVNPAIKGFFPQVRDKYEAGGDEGSSVNLLTDDPKLTMHGGSEKRVEEVKTITEPQGRASLRFLSACELLYRDPETYVVGMETLGSITYETR